jgi:hypothetical protein
VLGDTLALVPLGPPLTPHGLCRRRTQTTVVKRRRVSGCAATGATITVAVVDYYVLLLLLLLLLLDEIYALIFRGVCKISKTGCYLRHVRPPVRTEQLGSHWTDFHEISYVIIFENLSRQFEIN